MILQQITGRESNSVPLSLLGGRVRRNAVHRAEEAPPISMARGNTKRTLFEKPPPLSLLSGRVTRRVVSELPLVQKIFTQTYRVADDSYDRYELYSELDQMPDFEGSGQPVATSPTFPVKYTPEVPLSGQTGLLYNVTRKRNKYNLLDNYQHPTLVKINDLGEEELSSLTNPEILNLFDQAGGRLVVTARYPYGVDSDPADFWEIYVKAGSAPDPEVDSPDVVKNFSVAGSDYSLWYALTGLTQGILYYITVTVRRSDDSSDTEYGSDTDTITLAEGLVMDAGTAGAFGGHEYEIGI